MAAIGLSKLQKVSKLPFGLLVMPHFLHVLVMGVVYFLVSTFDKCFKLSIYSNERQLINCVFTFFTAQKLNFFTDSTVAILKKCENLKKNCKKRNFGHHQVLGF